MQELAAIEKEKERWRIMMETYKEPTPKEREAHVRRLQYEEGQGLFAVAYSTVHKAAIDGNVDGLKWFLTGKGRRTGGGDKINADDFDSAGNAPIHYAAERGHIGAIKFLLKRGCNIDLPNINGITPIMLAAKGNQLEAIQLCIDNDSDILKQNAGGMSSLHFAVQGDHIESLKLIADTYQSKLKKAQEIMEEMQDEYGDRVEDEATKDGKSAAESSNNESELDGKQKALFDSAIRMLNLPLRYDIEMKSKNGTTPLHMCASFDSQICLKYLIDAKVDVNHTDFMGETALHKAGRKNLHVCFDMLVAAGGVPTHLNLMHESPAQLLQDTTSY